VRLGHIFATSKKKRESKHKIGTDHIIASVGVIVDNKEGKMAVKKQRMRVQLPLRQPY